MKLTTWMKEAHAGWVAVIVLSSWGVLWGG